MAELADPPVKDFADHAMESLTVDPEAKTDPAPKSDPTPKADPSLDAKRVPDELFSKPAEKPSEKKVDSEEFEINKIASPDFKDPQRKSQWETLKAKGLDFEKQAKEFAQKATTLEAKIAEFEAKGKDTEGLTAKLAKMEKEHAEAMELVRKVNIELDPEFRARHIEGRSMLVKQARALVEESGLDPNIIETAINLRGKPRVDAIKALEEELGSFQASRLGRVIDELDSLDREAEGKRSSPEKYLEERKRQDEEQSAKSREEVGRKLNQSFEDARKRLVSEIEVLRPTHEKGFEWWNEQGKGIQDRALAKVNSLTGAHDAAEMAIKAEAMAVYRELYLASRDVGAERDKELAAAKDELKKLYGTNPGVRGNGGAALGDGKNRDFADRTTDTMQGR